MKNKRTRGLILLGPLLSFVDDISVTKTNVGVVCYFFGGGTPPPKKRKTSGMNPTHALFKNKRNYNAINYVTL